MPKQKIYTKTFPLPDGRRKFIRGKTKEELEEKVAQFKKEMLFGIKVEDRTTVKEYCEYWFKFVKAPNVSPNTAVDIHSRMKLHIYPYIGAMKVRDVRPANIRAVMRGCSEMSHGSQVQILSILRNVFAMAADEDSLILRSPVPSTLKARGSAAEEVKPLTPEQEAELLRVSQGKPVHAMIRVLLGTGLRRGEMTGLMWSDIDWDRKVLHVRRHLVTDRKGAVHLEDGAKTTAGVRTLPLTDSLLAFLREMRAGSKSLYLFTTRKGTLYSGSALSVLWDTLNKHLSFRCHPHQLRHTYVTKLFEAGLDIKEIQRLAGHSDPSVTLSTYTHYRAEMREEITLQRVREALA